MKVRAASVFKGLVGITAVLIIAGWSYLQHPKFGDLPEGDRLSNTEEAMNMETGIVLNIDGAIVQVSLVNSAAARDFLAQLPLTLTFEDYHGIEKVSDLPRRLSTDDAPEGFNPQVGSFTYYAPWGNLAIFYEDFGYARSLVNLGTVTRGMEHLTKSDSFTATISVAP